MHWLAGGGGDICTVGWTELIENASSADRESWVMSVMAQFRQTDDGDDVIPFVKLLIEEQQTTIILKANCFAFDFNSWFCKLRLSHCDNPALLTPREHTCN